MSCYCREDPRSSERLTSELVIWQVNIEGHRGAAVATCPKAVYIHCAAYRLNFLQCSKGETFNGYTDFKLSQKTESIGRTGRGDKVSESL